MRSDETTSVQWLLIEPSLSRRISICVKFAQIVRYASLKPSYLKSETRWILPSLMRQPDDRIAKASTASRRFVKTEATKAACESEEENDVEHWSSQSSCDKDDDEGQIAMTSLCCATEVDNKKPMADSTYDTAEDCRREQRESLFWVLFSTVRGRQVEKMLIEKAVMDLENRSVAITRAL